MYQRLKSASNSNLKALERNRQKSNHKGIVDMNLEFWSSPSTESTILVLCCSQPNTHKTQPTLSSKRHDYYMLSCLLNEPSLVFLLFFFFVLESDKKTKTLTLILLFEQRKTTQDQILHARFEIWVVHSNTFTILTSISSAL